MRDFALETYFSEWEFSAKHHMTASDIQSVTVGELLSLAGLPQDALSDLHLGYTETWGAPDLRAAIAETYDTLAAENILCFAGAEEGVYAAMRVLLVKTVLLFRQMRPNLMLFLGIMKTCLSGHTPMGVALVSPVSSDAAVSRISAKLS